MNGQEIQIKFAELLDITRTSFEMFLSHTEAAVKESRPQILAVDEDAADPSMLQLDTALLKAAPVAVVPANSEFFALQQPGHRFLLAADGLHLEVRRPWLHFIHKLADQCAVAMPYGNVAPRIEFDFGRISSALPQMKEFAAYAQAEVPIEAAASLIWNHARKEWGIRYPETIGEATGDRISYKQVELAEEESLAIDLHSHGAAQAFFSPQDDADDAGGVKISGVFGNLDTPAPTVAFRLCVLGLHMQIPVPAEMIFG